MPTPATLSIQTTEDGLAELRSFVEVQARAAGLPEAEAYDLLVAVHELAVNTMLHGYRGAPGAIDLELETVKGGVIARLRDHAPPFDPTRVPMPDTQRPLEQRPAGGFGIQLARHFTDTLEYRQTSDGCNELTLFKRHTNAGL